MTYKTGDRVFFQRFGVMVTVQEIYFGWWNPLGDWIRRLVLSVGDLTITIITYGIELNESEVWVVVESPRKFYEETHASLDKIDPFITPFFEV